ncbi:response regulator [Candidatus Poribacteria bacterium]|nr:response regulator [Candidatus Poribacteria bacterium]MXV75095.1 response regulator [Candidatus Poribacteria bacterium]MYB00462.1 response regulator [Candidatus Poribacteria bacterium]
MKTENLPPAEGQPETPKRILVIEDQELNRKVVRIVLQSRGYTVVEATDAVEALASLEDAIPQLILMDIALPGQSGEDLTKRIKANLAWVDIPIIALTAAAMSGDKERILKAGCDDYLSKPIDIKVLVERVETHLRRTEA